MVILMETLVPVTPKIPKWWKQRIVLVFFSLLIVAAIVVAWAWSQVIGFRAISGVYQNTRYQYSLTIPPNWRLATFLMLLLNSPQFGNRPTNDESVLMTELDRRTEWNLGRGINNDLSANPFPDYETFLSGQTILVQPERGDLDPRQLIEPEGNVQPVKTDSGVTGWRYQLTNETGGSSTVLIVWFPYPLQLVASSDDPFTGISIRTVEDKTYNQQTFESVYRSFQFTESD